MRTDELIDKLALEAAARPASGDSVSARIAGAMVIGTAGAALMMAGWFKVNPRLIAELATWHWWLKMSYGLVLALAGYAILERMSRPDGRAPRGRMVALAALGALVAMGAVQLAMAEPGQRMALWLGQSWRHCPYNILALSGPLLVAGMVAVRTLAPTRLARAGAGLGLMAGGTAMAVYCLHCPETEPAFIATWYSLGAILTTALGAALGPLALRWR